jgi:hypothetical protein
MLNNLNQLACDAQAKVIKCQQLAHAKRAALIGFVEEETEKLALALIATQTHEEDDITDSATEYTDKLRDYLRAVEDYTVAVSNRDSIIAQHNTLSRFLSDN